jgi:all-trans-retinol 13,14-reductase
VIIGGGIAGLCTGALLSKRGYRVLLVEAKSRIGGRANCQVQHSGFIVDWGIHSLRAGEAGIAAQLFQQLGLKLDVIPSGEGQLFHEGQWFSLPTSVQALMSTPLLSEKDRVLVGELFGSIMSTQPEELLSTSLAKWLDEFKVPSTILWIFQLYAGLILIEPDVTVASMGEMLDIMHTILRSGKAAGYPRGGWRAIHQALREVIERNGEIRLKSPVSRIHIEEDMVSEVQIGSDRISCDTIVAAVPPAALASILPAANAQCQKLNQLANQLIPTAGVSIDMGFSKPITEIPGLIVSSDPFVMGQATSNIDSTVAPSGKQLVTFYYPLSPEVTAEESKAKMALKQLETIIQQMFPKAPKPEWTRQLVLPVVDGAAPTIYQHRASRLPIKTEIRGLYLAGDAHNAPGAGGDIAFNAAVTCAQQIIELDIKNQRDEH